MTATELGAAPVLSTPDAHIFEESSIPKTKKPTSSQLSDEQVLLTYEIQRTVDEIRAGRWKRIALQFPDHMLVDAPRVFQALSRGLKHARRSAKANAKANAEKDSGGNAEKDNSVNDSAKVEENVTQQIANVKISADIEERLYILADTSYGACCVDEVAAEHAEADVVVHYGRSCLSPTARLPVIYVFTKPPLDLTSVVSSFKSTYSSPEQKIILMADIPFNSYLPELSSLLKSAGYTNIFTTDIIHNTSSLLPNRTVPDEVTNDPTTLQSYALYPNNLQSYALFHISDPPPSLLLTLHSRTGPIHILPTTPQPPHTTTPVLATSHLPLRRRYALLSKLSNEPIIGILLNTLSVSSYLTILAHLKRLIADAGKKSYTFVVGKVNAAKVANFSEVGGWVVVGCWESSLFENQADFWRPVVTPAELEWALKGVGERVWTGEWSADFGDVLKKKSVLGESGGDGDRHEALIAAADDGMDGVGAELKEHANSEAHGDSEEEEEEEESEPPEFDLRTGRYISHSRPMGRPSAPTPKSTKMTNLNITNPNTTTSTSPNTNTNNSTQPPPTTTTTLTKRAPSTLAKINGIVSPAAEYFKNNRSWQGLGSDYNVAYDEDEGGGGEVDGKIGAKMEQGRRGVARGYVVGDDMVKR